MNNSRRKKSHGQYSHTTVPSPPHLRRIFAASRISLASPAHRHRIRHIFHRKKSQLHTVLGVTYYLAITPISLPSQEIPLHTVMRITYDGWNPPREVRI